MAAGYQCCYDDLPAGALREGISSVAIDTETMGLVTKRDRLCLVQLSFSDGDTYLVQIRDKKRPAPHLKALLGNPKVVKLFHFARFDMASLFHAFGVMPAPVYCTKVASKLARTYTDRHGLRELCRELLGADISKHEQSSDWGREDLTDEQKKYAAKDVLYLHQIKQRLDIMLRREDRKDLADACFAFLAARVRMDLLGWDEAILQH